MDVHAGRENDLKFKILHGDSTGRVLDPKQWWNECWPHRLLPTDRACPREGVPEVWTLLSRRLPPERFLLLGPVSGDGLRAVDLPGKSARHRSLPLLTCEKVKREESSRT